MLCHLKGRCKAKNAEKYSKEHVSAGKRLSCICKNNIFSMKDTSPGDAGEATALLFWCSTSVFSPHTTYLKIFRRTYGNLIFDHLLRMENLHELLIQEWWGHVIHWCQSFLYLPG